MKEALPLPLRMLEKIVSSDVKGVCVLLILSRWNPFQNEGTGGSEGEEEEEKEKENKEE